MSNMDDLTRNVALNNDAEKVVVPPRQAARYKMVVSQPTEDDADSSVRSVDFRHVQHEHGNCACCGPRAK